MMPLLRAPARPGVRELVITFTVRGGRPGGCLLELVLGLGPVEHEHALDLAVVILREYRCERDPEQLRSVVGGDDDGDGRQTRP